MGEGTSRQPRRGFLTAADARASAARIVGRVMREGAYSNVVAGYETAKLNPSDRAVAHGLALDTIRRLIPIDQAIGRHATRSVDMIDGPLLDLLRVGAAELGRADRPAALSVDAIVRAAKSVDSSYTGFANAVLRKLSKADLDLRPEMPSWLTAELASEMDAVEIQRFWDASLETPETGVRAPIGGDVSGARPVDRVPGAWLIRGAAPDHLPVQDPASVAVGLSVEAGPGEVVFDMAAAPGGKTKQLVESGADVVAADRHHRRVRTAAKRVPEAMWLVADGRKPPFPDDTFDAVLVDAPCSGIGTLRRRPEIIHRMDSGDVSRMSAVGAALLDSAIALTKPGGRVIYSVCTVTPVRIDRRRRRSPSAPTDRRPPRQSVW